MKIRLRLAIYFTILVWCILLLFSILIYSVADRYKSSRFYSRLTNRAITNGKLLTEVNEIDSSLLKTININTITELSDEEIQIYRSNGQCIFSKVTGDTASLSSELMDRLRNGEMIVNTYRSKSQIILSYSGRGGTYYLRAAAIDRLGAAYLRNLAGILISGLALSLVITMAAGYFFAMRALLPITHINQQLDSISVKSLNSRVKAGNENDEIARLARKINQLLSRLESSFQSQKMFISGASHEMRTPLTTLTGQFEVALMKPRSAEEYKTLIESALDEIRTLNNMTNNLLELAQTSADFANLENNPVRLDEIIFEARQEIQSRLPEADISIHFSKIPDDPELFTVLGHANLLKISFKNILDNACKYSGNNKAEIFLDYGEEKLFVRVRDRGIGIAEQDLPHIFDSFYRAGNARTVGGHGIGLTIVQRIIELHNGTIHISSEMGQGTTVEVEIPRKPPITI